MNVLLVAPRFPDTFWSFRHALKFTRQRASLPPLGLLTVAALLPEAWGKRLVDTNVRRLGDADLAWADLVFIGATVAQRGAARELIARCRAAGRTVVAGGPLFTAEPEEFPEVDHLVLDEAEATLPAFLGDLARGAAQRVYRAADYPDVRCSPTPLWELADLRHYASASVQFSRGCPFACEFCSVTAMLGHRPRVKTPAQIVTELDALYARGWRGPVFFVDDNLIGKQRLVKEELLPALIAWRRGKKGFRFYTEASINLADDAELMRRMVEAGFDTVFIGIETPDEGSLEECGKHQNRGRDLVREVQRIQRAGLEVQGGFIVGFDSDTPDAFRRQREFIQKSGIVTAMVGLLNAPRGTRLYERLEREGRLIGQFTGDNVDGRTNFVPRMSMETLREGYLELLRALYAPRPYYRRVRTFLREYSSEHRPPGVSGSFGWRNLRAFAHSSVRLGVFGREALHYWSLLVWTSFRRPSLFPVAVRCAIYGHHFRRVCEALRH